jgi:hypothetical protein
MCGLGSGSGFTLRARAFAGLAWPGGGLGVWPAGLAQKPGTHWLRLLGYVVKAQAQARSAGLGLGPLRP